MADRSNQPRGRERASDSAGTKAIKDAEARAVKSVKEAEARATKSIRDAEARANGSIKESEARAAEAIRNAETHAAKAAGGEEGRIFRSAEGAGKAAERADRSAEAAREAAEAADSARERLDAAWADRAMDLAEREIVEGARAGDLALRQAKAANELAMAAGRREVIQAMGAATVATSSVNLPELDPYPDNPRGKKPR